MNKFRPKNRAMFLIGYCLFALLSGTLSAFALTQTKNQAPPTVRFTENISDFSSDLTLRKDGVLDVFETISINFADIKRHGIFRIIPIKYKRNLGSYSLGFKLLEVLGPQNKPIPYSLRQDGEAIDLKIGDAAKTVTGRQVYKIHYQVTKAINFFDKSPELYWNVTGNGWHMPIRMANAVVHLPVDVDFSNVKTTAYQGPLGSTNPARVKLGAPGTHTISFTGTGLHPGSGLTIVVGLPPGAVVLPTVPQEILWFIADWYEAFLLPLAAVVLLYFYWLALGRDKGAIKAVGVEWEPPKELSPAEVGTLIDETCDFSDITSTLIDLAARGFLTIKQIDYNGILMLSDKDYIFTRVIPQPANEPLKAYENTFLSALFENGAATAHLSSLKGHFYQYIPEIKRAIYDSLLTQKYFARDPEVDRHLFTRFGVLIIVVGLIAVICCGNDLRAASVGCIVSGILVALSAGYMPAKTERGSKALQECRAFQRFVRLAEKSRLEKLAKDDPTIFGRLLPYAMVLGCADYWAKAFKDLMTEPPSWYDSTIYTTDDSGTFLPNIFVNDLGRSMRSIDSVFLSPPARPSYASDSSSGPGSFMSGGGAGSGQSGFSSGGGFSGGGFGGGGGGSW